MPQQNRMRETLLPQDKKRRFAFPVIAVIVVAVVLIGYVTLGASSSTVSRDSLTFAQVQQVLGRRLAVVGGKVVAKNPQVISAAVPGRVDEIRLRPGSSANAGDIVLKLVNQSVADGSMAAAAALAAGVVDAEKATAEIQMQLIEKQSSLSDLRAQAEITQQQADAEGKLAGAQIISGIQANKSRLEALSAKRRVSEASASLRIIESILNNVRAAGRSQIERLEAAAALKKTEADSLAVRAPVTGVVQEVAVVQGQEVAAGTLLARMYDPSSLSVELEVPERQAGNISVGQAVSVTVAKSVIIGKIVRISPVVKDGVVVMEAELANNLLAGMRPELRLEAEIISENSGKTNVVRSPEGVRANVSSGVFVVNKDRAHKRLVKFGQMAGSQIEVVDGLQSGDVIIVSGLGDLKDYEELELK